MKNLYKLAARENLRFCYSNNPDGLRFYESISEELKDLPEKAEIEEAMKETVQNGSRGGSADVLIKFLDTLYPGQGIIGVNEAKEGKNYLMGPKATAALKGFQTQYVGMQYPDGIATANAGTWKKVLELVRNPGKIGIIRETTKELRETKLDLSSIPGTRITDENDALEQVKKYSKENVEAQGIVEKNVINVEQFYKDFEAYVDGGGRDDLINDQGAVYGWLREWFGLNKADHYFEETVLSKGKEFEKEGKAKLNRAIDTLINKGFEEDESGSEAGEGGSAITEQLIKDERAKRIKKYAIRDIMIVVLGTILQSGGGVISVPIPIVDIRMNFLKSAHDSGIDMDHAAKFMDWIESGMTSEFKLEKEDDEYMQKNFEKSITSFNSLREFTSKYQRSAENNEKYGEVSNTLEKNKNAISKTIKTYLNTLFALDMDTIANDSRVFNLGEKSYLGAYHDTETGEWEFGQDPMYKQFKDTVAKIKEIGQKNVLTSADILEIEKQRQIIDDIVDFEMNNTTFTGKRELDKEGHEIAKGEHQHRDAFDRASVINNNYGKNIKYLENRREELKEADIDANKLAGILGAYPNIASAYEVFKTSPEIEKQLENIFSDEKVERIELTEAVKKWCQAVLHPDTYNDYYQKNVLPTNQSDLTEVDVNQYKHGDKLDSSKNNKDLLSQISSERPKGEKISTKNLIRRGLAEHYNLFTSEKGFDSSFEKGEFVDIKDMQKGAILNTSRDYNDSHDTLTSFVELAEKKDDTKVFKMEHEQTFQVYENGKIVDYTISYDLYLRPDCANVLVVPNSAKVSGKVLPIDKLPDGVNALGTFTVPVVISVKFKHGNNETPKPVEEKVVEKQKETTVKEKTVEEIPGKPKPNPIKNPEVQASPTPTPKPVTPTVDEVNIKTTPLEGL